jgi:hypothetical protein
MESKCPDGGEVSIGTRLVEWKKQKARFRVESEASSRAWENRWIVALKRRSPTDGNNYTAVNAGEYW